MNYSGYQIETVIRQLRRLRGILLGRIEPVASRDPVTLSAEARERSRTVRLVTEGEAPAAGRTIREIYDETRFPPIIEKELERRAESFLDGADAKPPAASPIPKLRQRGQ